MQSPARTITFHQWPKDEQTNKKKYSVHIFFENFSIMIQMKLSFIDTINIAIIYKHRMSRARNTRESNKGKREFTQIL